MYLDDNRMSRGPFLLKEICGLVRDGEIDGLTLFWQDGMETWKPAVEIDSLKDALLSEEVEEEGKEDDGKIDTEENVAREVEEVQKVVEEVEKVVEEVEKGDGGLARLKEEEERRLKRKRKKDREKLKKLQRNNSSVYFRGVPPDTKEEEVAEFFSKCGIVKPDPDTGVPKVKLYRDKEGQTKGKTIFVLIIETHSRTSLAGFISKRTTFQEKKHRSLPLPFHRPTAAPSHPLSQPPPQKKTNPNHLPLPLHVKLF